MFTIAGIGSRKTPETICAAMFKIGTWCALHDTTVVSGHAAGADFAFESGAQSKCVVYLPWKGFNDKLVSKATFIIPEFTDEVMALAEQYHPGWKRLSAGVKKLIARDGFQVLGSDLKTPVDAVVCYTDKGLTKGGTGQAIRIAKDRGIPVLNMGVRFYDTADKVIHELSEIWWDGPLR